MRKGTSLGTVLGFISNLRKDVEAEKNALNSKYTLPSDGIPDTDLASDAVIRFTNAQYAKNGLNYGVKNNNSGNQAQTINALIASCSDYDTIYLPDGQYRITEPIVINKPITFICEGEIRGLLSAEGYCIVISSSNVKLRVRRISAYNANSAAIKIYSASSTIRYIDIDIDKAEGASQSAIDVITIVSGSYSVFNVNITAGYIYGNANVNGISCIKSGTGSIGEIHIYKARINNCKNGAYVANNYPTASNVSTLNGVCFIDVSFEINGNGVHFKNTTACSLYNCRIAEQMSGDYNLIKLEGLIEFGAIISRMGIRLKRVELINLDSSVSWRSAFFINAPVYVSDLDETPKSCALIYGGKIYAPDQTMEELVIT